ncbi:MAG: T9SS type A sorting domain-containing protein [Bacteroidetes bacterium]|nr:T9SS type A sorting domain-containing protein [Bacteroidota bacterium]
MFDVASRIVAGTIINNSYTSTLDVGELANGVYFVQVEDGVYKTTGKIIKN